MGNFLFFGTMSLALLGVRYKGDKRGQVLQHGNWMIKLVVWVLFMALPFLFPNGMVQVYGEEDINRGCGVLLWLGPGRAAAAAGCWGVCLQQHVWQWKQ